MKETSKHWKCPKCGATYHSPIKIIAVLCEGCTSKVRAKEQWMKPDE
jgi:DNA-directed RNA polymerase subunit RPC12/RpoP